MNQHLLNSVCFIYLSNEKLYRQYKLGRWQRQPSISFLAELGSPLYLYRDVEATSNRMVMGTFG